MTLPFGLGEFGDFLTGVGVFLAGVSAIASKKSDAAQLNESQLLARNFPKYSNHLTSRAGRLSGQSESERWADLLKIHRIFAEQLICNQLVGNKYQGVI